MSDNRAIYIGICSWTDKTLLSSGFYPSAAMTPASRLAFYATCFRAVEIGSTFYALPDPSRVFKWVAGTPDGFMFGVKSFALFTFHGIKFSALPGWLKSELGSVASDVTVRRGDLSHKQRMRLFDEFIRPIRTLHSMGRLAYLLFQFPPSWGYSREALGYIKSVRDVCGPLPLALEIRNNTWLRAENRDSFLTVLKRENIAYVAVDEPNVSWTPQSDIHLTSEWGTVVRFHGRNEAAWHNSRAPLHERFNYLYSNSELGEWKERLKGIRVDCKSTYLMFNNCVGDRAVKSAKLMSELLGE